MDHMAVEICLPWLVICRFRCVLRVKALTSVCMCLGRNGGWGGYRDIQKSHWLVPKTWGPIADPIAAQVASGCCCAWHGLQPLFRWCPLGLCRGGHPCCMLDTVVMSQLYHPGLAWPCGSLMMMSVASKRAVPHEFRHNMATWEPKQRSNSEFRSLCCQDAYSAVVFAKGGEKLRSKEYELVETQFELKRRCGVVKERDEHLDGVRELVASLPALGQVLYVLSKQILPMHLALTQSWRIKMN